MKTGVHGPEDPPRLLDEGELGTTGGDAFAAALLGSMSPHRPSAARKQRVRLNLGRGPSPRAPWFLRPTVVVAVLLGGAAAGSAALGVWPRWFGPGASAGHVRPVPAAPAAERPRPHRHRSGAPATDAEGALGAPSVPQGADPPGDPVVEGVDERVMTHDPTPRRAHESASRARGSSRVERVTQGPTLNEPARDDPNTGDRPSGDRSRDDDTWPVLEAVRALRREHDPGRARVLLAAYLEHHPNGTLAQEALALSIEAALVQHDPAAATLARGYLARHPRGAFRTLAQQALAASGSTAP